jgi:7-carboxy-7-deazaguanine synthase
MKIRVNEIFRSIDGEVNYFGQGRMSTFVRLQGCNLCCPYCDTKKAQNLEDRYATDIETVVERIQLLENRKVTITGGEPLLQREAVLELALWLQHKGYLISLETNGSLDPYPMPFQSIIMDWKMPSSGASDMMSLDRVRGLSSRDFVKFVCDGPYEVHDATDIWKVIHKKNPYVQGAFSVITRPFKGGKPSVEPWRLLEILENAGLRDVYLNFQIHKLVELR